MSKLKDNTVYYTEWNSRNTYIVLHEKGTYSNNWINIKEESFGSNGAFSAHSEFRSMDESRKIREATPIEARWLRLAMQEGKFVECPKEEVINSYQIY